MTCTTVRPFPPARATRKHSNLDALADFPTFFQWSPTTLSTTPTVRFALLSHRLRISSLTWSTPRAVQLLPFFAFTPRFFDVSPL